MLIQTGERTHMRALLCGFGLACLPLGGLAAAFQADSLVVLRTGDGVTALSGRLAPVFLAEYSTQGTLLQSLALPANDATQALTLRSRSGSEGGLALGIDGQSLMLAGYGQVAGQTRSTSAAVRVAEVSASGQVAVRSLNTLGNVTLTSASGSLADPWVGASSNLARVDASGALSRVAQDNVSRLQAVNGEVWVGVGLNGLVAQHGPGIYAASAATDGSVTLNSIRGDSLGVSAFSVLDLSPDVPGADTMYVANQNQSPNSYVQVRKFTLRANGQWVSAGALDIPGGTSLSGLAARAMGSQVQLFGLDSSGLYTATDVVGYTTSYSGALGSIHSWTTLATAAPDTAFRGLSVSPAAVPEASTWVLALAGLSCCAMARRRA
jgi:hypothetical protein